MDFEVPIKVPGTTYLSSVIWNFLRKSGYPLSKRDLSLTFDTVDNDILIDLPDT